MNLIGLIDLTRTDKKDSDYIISKFVVRCPHCQKNTTMFHGIFNTCIKQKCNECREEVRVIHSSSFCTFCRDQIECLSIPTIVGCGEKYWRRSVKNFMKRLWDFAKEDWESLLAVVILILAAIGAATVCIALSYIIICIVWFMTWFRFL